MKEKTKVQNKKVKSEKIEEDNEINDKEITKKANYTIEELIDLYREFEKLENTLKNIMLDLNSLKLKQKNMDKKIKNATLFIEEIDNHKKSIFEFWKYSNKDEMATLPEGEEEEVNIIKRITKFFDYEDDIEKFGKTMDKRQRQALSKQETDSVYITSTNLIEMINKLKKKEVVPKEVTASLNQLKKEAIEEKTLTENDEFDIFGGMVQDSSKVSKINNKKHREIAKDKFAILDINKTTKQMEYKLALQKVIENVKTALEKVVISEDLPVYKAMQDTLLDENEINVFDINPEMEMKEAMKQKESKINFYKIHLKQGSNAVSFTNCIFYDNQNKTLPVGQDLSTKILVDVSNLNMELKGKSTFKMVDFEKDNEDFSTIKIKTITVFEYEV